MNKKSQIEAFISILIFLFIFFIFSVTVKVEVKTTCYELNLINGSTVTCHINGYGSDKSFICKEGNTTYLNPISFTECKNGTKT